MMVGLGTVATMIAVMAMVLAATWIEEVVVVVTSEVMERAAIAKERVMTADC